MLREALSGKTVWLLMLSRVLTDPVWYFFLFWFPKYLSDARVIKHTTVRPPTRSLDPAGIEELQQIGKEIQPHDQTQR